MVKNDALVRLVSMPDRRPLYLDAREATTILLEGPALRIRVSKQAERDVPLRRISRVVTNHRTQFTTDALLACADRGISVVFLSEDGEVRARILSGKPLPLVSHRWKRWYAEEELWYAEFAPAAQTALANTA